MFVYQLEYLYSFFSCFIIALLFFYLQLKKPKLFVYGFDRLLKHILEIRVHFKFIFLIQYFICYICCTNSSVLSVEITKHIQIIPKIDSKVKKDNQLQNCIAIASQYEHLYYIFSICMLKKTLSEALNCKYFDIQYVSMFSLYKRPDVFQNVSFNIFITSSCRGELRLLFVWLKIFLLHLMNLKITSN